MRGPDPALLTLLAVILLSAQGQPGGDAALAALQASEEQSSGAVSARFESPFDAYAAGRYDQALQGFVDLQVERPDDPEIAFNVGAAHYHMRNYAEADRAFGQGLLAEDQALRQQALYNLGNSAYRQGRLQEAVELYKSALELDPDDEDAKFNLEFVRDEIRRRHEEAQKRQQQGEQPQPDAGQQQNEQQSSSQQEQSNTPEQQGADEQRPQAGEEDADRDGLPDRVEREGENPTDPQNPDSDGDGLPDGAEDLDRNGRVDPGETDPNKQDSDGDGTPDGAEGSAPSASGQPGEESERLSPEEAERYLQALSEGQPVRRHPQGGQRARADKDW